MAENPIKGSDFIDSASILTELNKVLVGIREMKEEVQKTAVEIKKSLNVKGNTEARAKAVQKQTENIKKLNTEFKVLTKSEQELLTLEKKLIQSRSTSADKATELKLAIADQNKINKQFVTINTAAEGSIKKVGAQLAQSKRRYSELSKAQRDNQKVGGKLLKQIKEQDKEYKKLQIDIGNTGVNVGNYTDSINQAVNSSGLFGTQLAILARIQGTLTAITKKKTQAQVASNAATGIGTKVLKIFKIALAATGIGLLVVALGSLIAFFTRSQKGVDFLRVASAGLSAGFDVLIDRLAAVGDFLFEAFSNPKQAIKDLGQFIIDNILNRFKAMIDLVKISGKAFSALADLDLKKLKEAAEEAGTAFIQLGTGLDAEQQQAFADAISGVNDELQEEIRLALKLEDLHIDLLRRQKLFAAQEATQITRTKELTKIVLNKLNADEDRLEAVKKIADIEIGIANKQLQLEKESLAASLDSIAANGKGLKLDSQRLKFINDIKNGNIDAADAVQKAADFTLSSAAGEEALFEIIEKITNIEAAKQALLQKQATTQKRIGSITREIAAKEAKALLVQAAAQKEILKNQDLLTSTRIEAADKVRQFEIESAEVLLAANSIAASELVAIKLKSEAVFNASVQKLNEERQSQIDENLQGEIDAINDFTESQLKLRELALRQQGKTEEEIAEQLVDDRIALFTQQAMMLQELGEDTLDIELKIAKLRVSTDKEANEEILKNRKALNEFIGEESAKLAQDGLDKAFELNSSAKDQELDDLKTKFEEEDALLAESVAKGEKTEEEARIIKESREKTFREKEKQIQKEQARAEKQQAIFQATINGIQAVIKAGGFTPKGIATGIFNLASIALIAATPLPTFGEGGIFDPETGAIGGKSHASGGTVFYDKNGKPQFEAEKGEVLGIIKKDKVPLYNWINSQSDEGTTSGGGGDGYKLLGAIKRNGNVNIKNAPQFAEMIGRATAKHTKNGYNYALRYG